MLGRRRGSERSRTSPGWFHPDDSRGLRRHAAVRFWSTFVSSSMATGRTPISQRASLRRYKPDQVLRVLLSGTGTAPRASAQLNRVAGGGKLPGELQPRAQRQKPEFPPHRLRTVGLGSRRPKRPDPASRCQSAPRRVGAAAAKEHRPVRSKGQSNTTVLFPYSNTRSSKWRRTARAKTTFSRSRPFRTKSSIESR